MCNFQDFHFLTIPFLQTSMLCLHCKPNKELWFWSSNAWLHIVLVMLSINTFVMIRKRKIECKKKRKEVAIEMAWRRGLIGGAMVKCGRILMLQF